MASRHFAPAARATVLLKDLELISRLAAELGLDLPHVASTRALYEELVARGHGGLDVSALYTLRVDARGER
jgi:3-hydroxyisobutyrate dehydrogenase-like beta-hydroxyacid dehydrogenase